MKSLSLKHTQTLSSSCHRVLAWPRSGVGKELRVSVYPLMLELRREEGLGEMRSVCRKRLQEPSPSRAQAASGRGLESAVPAGADLRDAFPSLAPASPSVRP